MNGPMSFGPSDRDLGLTDEEAPTSNERTLILARFIRNQVALADRPPPGCIQLNNDEALLCAEALERGAVETSRDVFDRYPPQTILQKGADGIRRALLPDGSVEIVTQKSTTEPT